MCCDAGGGVAVESEGFWQQGYVLRRTSTGSPVAPRFLQALLPQVLSAGKSVILMAAHQHSRDW